MYYYIKPQPGNLQIPEYGTLLYKIIPADFFLDEFKKSYLYFQRVDQYKDLKDSTLPLKVRKELEKMTYKNDQNFNEAKRYERQRSRTYVCCFSTENTSHIILSV